MLCQFTFENFASYKNETTFDMQATAAPEFTETLIAGEKGTKLLPVSAVYGPNGGGKSNLLKALSCLIGMVTDPIHLLSKNHTKMIIQQTVECVPFSFDAASETMPTKFEIFFRREKNEYRYQLSVLDGEVKYEALYWRAVGGKRTGTLFTREGERIVLGAQINKENINLSVNPKMPYLSFLAITYNIPMIREVQSWFESCVIRNYANAKTDNTILFTDDEQDKKHILRLLNDVGIDLTDYRLDEQNDRIYTQRKIEDKIYELNFVDESEGTKKLFAMMPMLWLALKEGRLMVVDELDAKLHPKLLRFLIGLFKNKMLNTKGAQLVFTAQDVSAMKSDILRRDEIWFVEQNAAHESELYSLYDIRDEDNQHRVNNTAAYDKQYMEGRYGATPYLTNGILEEIANEQKADQEE